MLYRDIDRDLRDRRVPQRSVLLHGFSRGAANVYALAALDANRGGRHIAMVLANAGGAAPDFPPNRRIDAGGFGANPFAGLRFATFCGGRDPNPDRDGCPAMSRTADWVRRLGGNVVLSIADPAAGHGGFHRTPEYVSRALDAFLDGSFVR